MYVCLLGNDFLRFTPACVLLCINLCNPFSCPCQHDLYTAFPAENKTLVRKRILRTIWRGGIIATDHMQLEEKQFGEKRYSVSTGHSPIRSTGVSTASSANVKRRLVGQPRYCWNTTTTASAAYQIRETGRTAIPPRGNRSTIGGRDQTTARVQQKWLTLTDLSCSAACDKKSSFSRIQLCCSRSKYRLSASHLMKWFGKAIQRT